MWNNKQEKNVTLELKNEWFSNTKSMASKWIYYKEDADQEVNISSSPVENEAEDDSEPCSEPSTSASKNARGASEVSTASVSTKRRKEV